MRVHLLSFRLSTSTMDRAGPAGYPQHDCTWRMRTAVRLRIPSRPPAGQDAHVAAAAYLMKHAGATALMIRDRLTDQPIGIITEADIAGPGHRGTEQELAR
jgi:hypothetical protein